MPATPVTLIQVTDTHIFDDPAGILGGVNTRQSLQRVLDYIAKHFANADLLVLTGDNTHEATEVAYRALKAMVEPLDIPYTFLPGNHDYEKPMLALSSEEGDTEVDKWMSIGNWNILLLDSHEEKKVNGRLAQDELDFVQSMLASAEGPVLAFVHHPLLPVGCDWLDKQRIANADALFRIVSQHKQLKAIVNGHVHQEWSGEQHGIKLFSTPSTCMQFKPNSHDYAEEQIAPGFRWFKLHDDGRFETAVVRVK